ncbi:hypothetical protein So717_28310 [Roseobacter cerasinus]|uniref:MotA/TolQ/ExbB proton channel domain-containing protein n=1 Tax=Roseobacter cerasinus TaxID=2602289 RepID=A0A640VRR0_9RHOB|nr:MotA/TolQ/ExbB proton channel family protein [Roseobacter cerasinus]GFE51078.1 hypothetical protein So717_28310 [Roseobacter cerasinus]
MTRFLKPLVLSVSICVLGAMVSAQEIPEAGPDLTTAPPVLDAPQNSGLEENALAAETAPVSPVITLDTEPESTADQAKRFLQDGGPAIWAITALSVITMALILWKLWRLALIGAWSKGRASQAVAAFEQGQRDEAQAIVRGRRGIRSKVIDVTLGAARSLPEDKARETASRVARNELAQAGGGLRALELIATIAPLLGLLGTVLGMIAAFQALQAAGNRADPALLAGGIWEALLTTAAGMAVAIPASAALTWFEAVIDRIRRDIEDGVTRIFVAHTPPRMKLAAE